MRHPPLARLSRILLVALFLLAISSSSSFQPRVRTRPYHSLVRQFHFSYSSPLSSCSKQERTSNRSSTLRGTETTGASDDVSTDRPKQFLTKAYAAGQYFFGAASFLIFAMPDRTMTTLLASKLGGFAGFALASGLCHILKGATVHGRLNSDTYKRLNVGLLGFCGLGLAAFPGEAAFMNLPAQAFLTSIFLTLVKLYGTFVSVVGWKKGVLNEDTIITFAPRRMLQEFVKGSKETWKGMKVQDSKKALTYRNCLVLVGMGIVSSFMEGIFNIRYQKEFTRTWFEISLQWSAVARLFMISTMIYSLKDAAERDRLTGTTFIQLNLMVGFWACVVGLGQAVYPLGFAAYRGVEMFAFSFPFFLKAFKSLKEKSEAKRMAS